MDSYEHPFDKAADDAMFAAYMSSEFFELPSEETDSTDSGITDSTVVSDDDLQATIEAQRTELGRETNHDAGGGHCYELAVSDLPLTDTHGQDNTYHSCDLMNKSPSVVSCVSVPGSSPPHLLASVIHQDDRTVSTPVVTTSKKRSASDVDRAGRRPAPKRIRTSIGGSRSRHPRRTANPVGQLQASPDYEGNALIQHKSTSSTSNCEDNILAEGTVPDTVTVLGRGPPPSRPAKRTRQGNKTPYLSTEFNCHICKTGFVRLPDLERHNGTAGHAEQARQKGIEVTIEVNDSLRCPVPHCKVVKPYSRRDALMRHMREKHPGIPIPRT